MKTKTKLIFLIVLTIMGIALIIWGNIIMLHYEGYREIMKAARNAALPQLIGGIVILFVAYILTYVRTK